MECNLLQREWNADSTVLWKSNISIIKAGNIDFLSIIDFWWIENLILNPLVLLQSRSATDNWLEL